jgi:hypothetical protein
MASNHSTTSANCDVREYAGFLQWFAANGLKALSHSTTSAYCELGEYDGLLPMVGWLPTILLHQQIAM